MLLRRRVWTHLVQADVRVELVHVLAQLLVGGVGAVDPALVRVHVAHELGEVDDAAQEVAQAVEVLDHGEEGALGLVERLRRWCGSAQAVDEDLGAEGGAVGEVGEVFGRLERGLAEQAGRSDG